MADAPTASNGRTAPASNERPQAAGQPEHISVHIAGLVFAEHFEDGILTVGSRIIDFDAILRLERSDERPNDLIDNEVGIVNDRTFLLRLAIKSALGSCALAAPGMNRANVAAQRNPMSARLRMMSSYERAFCSDPARSCHSRRTTRAIRYDPRYRVIG